jgi:hypothetical protein
MPAPKEKIMLADLHREDRDAMVLAAIQMTGPLVEKAPVYQGELDLNPPPEVDGGESEDWQGVLKVVGSTSSHPEWSARLKRNFLRVRMMMEDNSPLVDSLDVLDRCRIFDANVVSVELEEKSTRGIVTLKSAPSTFHPDGMEQVRTERTDSEDGKLMAHELYSLIGHRVRVWVEKVTFKNGSNTGEVRIVRFVQDLGKNTGKN